MPTRAVQPILSRHLKGRAVLLLETMVEVLVAEGALEVEAMVLLKVVGVPAFQSVLNYGSVRSGESVLMENNQEAAEILLNAGPLY
jgi:hypothetical protein